ncbi:MAG: hypothetical protein D6812_05455 [Deltaproteobacteria bacterium]|nr:MAG: hypothetical protein D6812_05455 [Deltaproteobacteria bacterium]
MQRILRTSLFPHRVLPESLSDFEVFCANRNAAIHLGVPYRALHDAALETLADRSLAQAPRLAAHQLLRSAVREVCGGDDPLGMARVFAPVLREIFRAGLDAEGMTRVGIPRLHRIAQVALAYRKRLRRRGYVDEAEVLWEAARCGPRRRRILVYGYPRFGEAECAFLDAFAGEGSICLLPYSDHPIFRGNTRHIQVLAEKGWRIEGKRLPPADVGEALALRFLAADHGNASLAGVVAESHADPEAEVRGALAQIKSLVRSGVSLSEIVLTAREVARYGPTVLAVAREYGIPLRAFYTVALRETMVGGWVAEGVILSREGFPFQETYRWFGHPLSRRLFGGGEWRQAREKFPQGQKAWGGLGFDLSPVALPPSESRRAFTAQMRALLLRLREGVKAQAREILALQCLLDELDALGHPAAEPLSRESFVEEFLEALTLLTVEIQPGRGGVAFHAPINLYGMRVPHLFVLGMNEGVFPAPVAEDPLLDFHLRRRIVERMGAGSFEQATEAACRERIGFYALLTTATEGIHLSCVRTSENRPMLPSSHFHDLCLKPRPARWRVAASPEEARAVSILDGTQGEDPVVEIARHAWRVAWDRETAPGYDEYDGIVGEATPPESWVFSATQLIELGQCPFKWFALRRLGLRDREMEEGFSPALRGRLFHRTLELAVEGALSDGEVAPFREAVCARLEGAFCQAEGEVGVPPLPAWAARRREAIEILRRAVSSPDFLLPDAEVVATEREFSGEWLGLVVEGVIDRIDRTPEGYVLIDYKSSASRPLGIKDASGRLAHDLQLPLYRRVFCQEIAPEGGEARAYYFALSRGKAIQPRQETPIEVLTAFVAEVATRLRQGVFPVSPDIDGKACSICPLDRLCRQGPRLRRKGEDAWPTP